MINMFTEPEISRLFGKTTGPAWKSERTDQEIRLHLLTAGFLQEEIEVEVIDGLLEVRAETERSLPELFGSSSWKKRWRIENLDTSEISASMEAGILTLTIKAKEAKGRKIKIG